MFLCLKQALPSSQVEMPLSIYFKKKTKQKQTKIKTKNENLYLGKSVHAEQPNYELIPV